MAEHLVPTVDISAPTETMLEALDQACVDHGFFLLSGHGLDELIERTWAVTEEFFAGDRNSKVAVMRDADNPLGYFDRELTKRKRDSKEVFDFTDPTDAQTDQHNRWPTDSDEFHSTLVDFYDAFSELALRTNDLVHRSLEFAVGSTLDSSQQLGSRLTSSVRLNHYPVGDPVPAAERSELHELGETALGYHTDPGVLTLLLQDTTGGLQAQATDGSWVDIEPTPGTIVVNLADAMQVWTNDRYRAAVHRVVPMTTTDRYSIPYFFNPPRDAVVEPISGLAGDAKYAAFRWRDYMRARTDDNFADAGVDDAQITDYLLVN